jgi:hypothetical protein
MNIIITSAIAGRLLKMRAQVRKLLGHNHASPYTSVVSVLVESAAIYTGWAIMFLVPFAREDTFQNFVLPSLGQVQVRRSPCFRNASYFDEALSRELHLCSSYSVLRKGRLGQAPLPQLP